MKSRPKQSQNKSKTQRPRRVRRDNATLENDIMYATKALIEEQGFTGLTTTGIMRRARIEPQIFYNRYKNLDALLDDYVRRYDYYLGAFKVSNIEQIDVHTQSHYYQLLINLMYTLYNDRSMQRMLMWEVCSDNPITRHSAQLREDTTKSLIEKYDKAFKGTNVDIRAALALLVAGVYYLILRRDVSTFCGVDFSTNEGKQRLAGVIEFMTKLICDKLPPQAPKASR